MATEQPDQGGIVKHYAEYLFPGILMSESSSRELPERTIEAALTFAPEGAFCFTFYDLPDVPQGTEDYDVVPKRKNVSGKHYLGGTLYDLAQVEAMGDDKRILASNMRGNGYPVVVLCRTGNWQPFVDGDVLVPV